MTRRDKPSEPDSPKEPEPLTEEERADLEKLAKPLLEDRGELHNAIHAIEDLGVVGERKNIGLVRLMVRSRVLERPVNAIIYSPSSSGKTHLVTSVLKLEHPSAFYEMTAGSEKALVYLDESLRRRVVYIQEPEGLPKEEGRAVIKSLAWEGRVKYDTVTKVDGALMPLHLEIDGPTGLILTSTRKMDDQTMNRMLLIELNDSEQQTRRIIDFIAKSAAGDLPAIDAGPWQAASRLIGESVIDVQIPFAVYLAPRVDAKSLRVRRDFTQFLNLIRASAIEYQYQRSRDEKGRLIATLADYGHAYVLGKDSFQAVQAEGITDKDREMITTIGKLVEEKGGPVSQADIRAQTGLTKGPVSSRVNKLLGLDYLENKAPVPKGKFQIVLGAPLPEKLEPLPSPCDVANYLSEEGLVDLITPWVNPLTGLLHDCHEHIDYRADAPIPKTTETSKPWCPRCGNTGVPGPQGAPKPVEKPPETLEGVTETEKLTETPMNAGVGTGTGVSFGVSVDSETMDGEQSDRPKIDDNDGGEQVQCLDLR